MFGKHWCGNQDGKFFFSLLTFWFWPVSAHFHPWQIRLHLFRQLQWNKGKIKISLLYHIEDLTLGQKGSLTIRAPSFPKPSRLSPTSPKTGLRCLPLKSRMGSNRTSAFNGAAVLSQGPLMELQDWDLGQLVCEKNESWGLLQWGAMQRGFWCLHGQTPQRVEVCADAQLSEPHLERID